MPDINTAVDRLKRYFTPRVKTAFLATIVCCLCTHLVMYVNYYFIHDNVSPYSFPGNIWSAERFAYSFIARILSGGLYLPVIVAILSIVALSITVLFVAKLFEVRNNWCIWLIAMLIVTFPATSVSYSYYSSSYIYNLAAMAGAMSAYYLSRSKNVVKGTLLGLVLVYITCGMYQSYVFWVASLLLMRLIFDALENEKPISQLLLCALRYLIVLGVCIGLYYATSSLILKVQQREWEAYAGQRQAWDSLFSPDHLLFRLKLIYRQVYKYFFDRDSVAYIPRYIVYANWVMTILATALTIRLMVRRRIGFVRTALIALAVFLLPLAMNGTLMMVEYFEAHGLMCFAFVIPLLYFSIILDQTGSPKDETIAQSNHGLKRIGTVLASWIILVGLLLTVMNNRIFANTLYLEMKLNYDRAYAMMNRIVLNIQNTDGYTSETEVVLVGELDPDAFTMREGLEQAEFYVRLHQYWLSVYMDWFVDLVMNEDIPITRLGAEEACDATELALIETMSEYPSQGYTQMVGDKVYVKLGPFWDVYENFEG